MYLCVKPVAVHFKQALSEVRINNRTKQDRVYRHCF